MEKRIKWKDGMEIGSEVFILSDKYHLSKTKEIGMILASVRYGIVKGSLSLDQFAGCTNVTIKGLLALTSDGTIVNIEEMQQEVHISNEGYIVIRHKGTIESDVDGIPFEEPLYECLCTSDIYNGDLIIGRMNERGLLKGYIPPCYLIGAHPALVNTYERCINLLHSVREKIKTLEQIGDTLQLDILTINLSNLGVEESPKSLYLAMIKIIHCLHKLYPSSQQPIIPPINHLDLTESMIPIQRYLEQYFHDLDNFVKPVIVEPVEEKKVEKKYKIKI